MQNKLFDSIVRSCGADTDDIHSGEAEGNFWAENELFEAVLREAGIPPVEPPSPIPSQLPNKENEQNPQKKKREPEEKDKNKPLKPQIKEPNKADLFDLEAKTLP